MSNLEFDALTISRFSSVLRYNVEIYLNLYSIFIKNNYPLIYNYFTKPGTVPDTASFDFLTEMNKEADKLNSLLKVHGNSFQKVDDWNFLDFIEDIRIKLETINNLSKWTRSTLTKNSWSVAAIQTNYQLKQYQTLEDITLSLLNDNNEQNDWQGVALENNLFESDYSIKGGAIIEISQPLGSTNNLFLNSIVDNLTGNKVYGLDFNNKMNWINNDLAKLSYIDTVKQAVNTLITLRKSDIPEFYDMGVDRHLLTGTDIGSLSYVSIIRQLNQLFTSDDSLRNFKVNRFSYNEGRSFIDYSVDTFYNLTYNSTQPLTTN